MINSPFKRGFTFDDILLLPEYSEILPAQVTLTTVLTRNISLNIPLVSAAMDTVTESKMAIRLAQEGGMGVIHKNLTPDEQAAEVLKVKKSESIIIRDPITILPNATIGQARDLMSRHDISGLPVVEGSRLKGILTHRDLRFEVDDTSKVSKVMTHENLVTVREPIQLEQALALLHRHRIEKLLVVNENYDLKGLITFKDIEKAKDHPQSSKDAHGRLLVGAAVGVTRDFEERVEKLVKAGVDCLFMDSAHGHSKNIIEHTRYIKKNYPSVDVVAGNIGTEAAGKALVDIGADAVKVGIGPGSICTTRVISGVGVPQVTAIMDVAAVCSKAKVPVIADGGIRFSGDILKALAVGADTVMIGGVFAGTDESPGQIVLYQGRSYKEYHGMGSLTAMKKGSADRYFQEDVEALSKFVPEGVEARVPHKGPLQNVVHQLLGGVRSGMGYLGASTIQALREKARFVEISNSGLRESHIHDIMMTEEPPNYPIR